MTRIGRGKLAEDQANAWNREHPVGTLVRYWTGIKEGPGQRGTTTHAAGVMGGTAVVWIDTSTKGCIALSHVEALTFELPGVA